MASSTVTLPSPGLITDLLDVSKLESHSQILRRFSEIAEAIFYDHCLRVEHEGTLTDFEILEIEFYLYKVGVHDDPFCHAHDDQRRSAQWYFHRAPRSAASPVKPCSASTDAGGYRGGTRKGLDLTFGSSVTSPFFPVPQDSSPQTRGGILLRSMRLIDGSGNVISGPSLLVDKILSITKSRNIAELVGMKLGGCISALPPTRDSATLGAPPTRLYLAGCPRKRNTLPTIHRSPRVGLDLTHPSVTPHRNNPRVVYISKLYRHFIRPELLKANGRCHTLLGLLLEEFPVSLPQSQLLDSPMIAARLMKMTHLKRATLENYIENYTQGFTKRSLAEYTGAVGKGASSNSQMFMRMMGVLRRMGLLTGSDQSFVTDI